MRDMKTLNDVFGLLTDLEGFLCQQRNDNRQDKQLPHPPINRVIDKHLEQIAKAKQIINKQ